MVQNVTESEIIQRQEDIRDEEGHLVWCQGIVKNSLDKWELSLDYWDDVR